MKARDRVGVEIRRDLENQVAERRNVEAADVDAGRERQAAELGQRAFSDRARGDLLVPRGDEHHGPFGGEIAHDERQQVEGGVVGPMQVFDGEEERTFCAQRHDELKHCVVQLTGVG